MMAMGESSSPFARALGRSLQVGGAFLEWWMQELLAMLPASWRGRLRLFREQVEMSMGNGDIVLHLVTFEGTRHLRTFKDDALEPGVLLDTLNTALINRRRLVLKLSGHGVLVRRITLPVAVAENLGQVLRYEMDRYTPFKAESVYFGYQVSGLGIASDRLRVSLAVVPRAFLDQRLRDLTSWGIQPERVEVEALPGVNLLPVNSANRGLTRQARWRALGLGLVTTMLCLALLLPLWKLRQVAITLDRAVAEVQLEASRAQELRQERDHLLEQAHYLIERKQSRYPVVVVLNELAVILPDDTWIQSLQFADRRLVIQGFSGAASGLIGRIEQSDLFDSVTFIAPVTRDRASSQEIFQISMVVREVDRE